MGNAAGAAGHRMICTCDDKNIEGCELATAPRPDPSPHRRWRLSGAARRNAATSDNPAKRLVAQALGLGVGLGLYMAVRALSTASSNEAIHNASRLLRFEDALGIDIESSFQKAALGFDWLITGANWFYSFAYWPMIFGTLIYTWMRHREVFVRYRNALIFSGLIGLVIFALFPVAPPRFLDGYVDTINSAARHQFIAYPSWLINENAALPSFHVGWVVLSAVLLIPLSRRWFVKALLTIPGIVMALTVIVTGNHYLVDIFAGIAISLAGLQLARWRDARRPGLSTCDEATRSAVAETDELGRNPGD